MIAVVGKHRSDNAEVVDVLADLREDLADLNTALAILLKAEGRGHEVAGRAVRLDFRTGHRLAVALDQAELGIE